MPSEFRRALEVRCVGLGSTRSCAPRMYAALAQQLSEPVRVERLHEMTVESSLLRPLLVVFLAPTGQKLSTRHGPRRSL